MNITKGRGLATNVPEISLINLVKIRPLLYDKNVKDYRKPGASDTAWIEIAAELSTSVANCKKRWKSLRDTFIKYYRIEHMQDKSQDGKRRRWHFYEMMKFLEPHVELFRLDGSIRLEESQKEQTIPVYLKDDFIEVPTEDEKHFYFAEESPDGDGIRYQIKIDENYEDEQQEEEQIIETFIEESPQDNGDKKSNEYVIMETPQEEEEIKSNQTDKDEKETLSILQTSPESSQKPTTDPDERYLLSCLPAFKRLTPQQKALVRIGIEKLFYEVEFEIEPMSKRFKSS